MDPIEDFMRNTLKKIMMCPSNDDDYFVQQPVAALSPARYMQLVALVQKDSKELSCGKVRSVSFEINDPRTWNFCAMGVCLSEECVCFQNFKSDKCNKFHGNCWLFYCFLVGCELDLPSLHCGCDSSLYGRTVTSGIYFYDEGLDINYRPPPNDFITIDEIETPIIRETFSGTYEVIGGNNRRTSITNASSRSYHKKTLPDIKQDEYFLRRSDRLHSEEFPSVHNVIPQHGARGNQFKYLQQNYFKNNDRETPERRYYQEKDIKSAQNLELPDLYNENNNYEENQFRPNRQHIHSYEESFYGKSQNRRNIFSNYKNLRNKYSNWDFMGRNRLVNDIEPAPFKKRRKFRSRNLPFSNHILNNDLIKSPIVTNDWEQYIQPRTFSKFERTSRGIIRNRENFYEQQSGRQIRSELSTLKALWSDSEEDIEESDFKFVSENGKLSTQVSQYLFIIEIFVLTIIFL
ncbi:uncharacterized protein TNCT_667971 [Trichonephila clavata]|uniref:Uncharacterized protein n=1 Tax=Trichonephila clavata TaxID=2740835 RepID=A0A8X6G9K7_TRICU|nr:uncharacterized protein TNCT_667971 [Trichonephila clavata]